MRSENSSWSAALLLSGAALLSFLARTFLDYGYVYPELNLTTASLGLVTAFNLVFFAGWIWAIVSASHGSRRGMAGLVVYDAILVVFGLATLLSFCPSPCRTAWPIGEIAIWSNLLVGVPAAIMAPLSLVGRKKAVP